jgi:antitoxin (DNA-binding transcriptional repressor) of toxin-antitoxin stability system
MVIVATVHITAGELADDVPGVLAKVRNGLEVIVEQDHHPIAIIRPPSVRGRMLSESIALAEARGTTAIPDEGFMRDVEEGIIERSRPWNPPSWE